MFWEFATDNYDIGFGVYFEWTIDPPTQVSVQVSESSDEEDLDEEYPEGKDYFLHCISTMFLLLPKCDIYLLCIERIER